MTDDYRHYPSWIPNVRAAASIGARRARAAGLPITFEDLEQECAIAWCRARDAYDPADGRPFAPYLKTVMSRHVNDVLGDLSRAGQSRAVTTLYDPTDESAAPLVPDAAERTDETLARRETHGRVYATLSPEALRVAQWLADPPPFLQDGLKALQARVAWGRQRGHVTTAPTTITIAMILDAMGLRQTDRTKVRAELARLVDACA